MKRTHKLLLALVAIIVVFAVFAVKSTRAPDTSSTNAPNAVAAESVSSLPKFGTPSFSASDKAALEEAIQNEYKAEALYEATVAEFGQVAPFASILEVEPRHSQALATVLVSYKEPVPTPMPYEFVTAVTIEQACMAALSAEKENIALYGRLMERVQNSSARTVFFSNAQASQLNHLPAFEQCAQSN